MTSYNRTIYHEADLTEYKQDGEKWQQHWKCPCGWEKIFRDDGLQTLNNGDLEAKHKGIFWGDLNISMDFEGK